MTTIDRRSVTALSALLLIALLFAAVSLIVVPRFFSGQLRGSYHFWLIAGRCVPLIGVMMALPALMFGLYARRNRQIVPAVVSAILIGMGIALIALGDEMSMQFRLFWDAGDTHYYAVHDHLYLPPLDTQLETYAVKCNAHDLECVATPLGVIPDAWFLQAHTYDSGEGTLLICERSDPPYTCHPVYDLAPGVPDRPFSDPYHVVPIP